MKKLYNFVLYFLMFIVFTEGYSQQYDINLSPEGKFETVYDNRGNQLKLKDILIDAPKDFGYSKTTSITCSTTSYFNLYFEPGCGMEDTSNPIHNARRTVLCKVYEDISNFITSPLSTTGNKVNIWVRNIANENVSASTLGLASPFYTPQANSTNTIGGILDGEIWKTIHLGVDSYTNISSGTNVFYHGKVAVNFNDTSINWNTNLAITTPSNSYDLYSVMLHEVAHSLGINSFINQDGTSIDPSPYYSRYDTFLQTNNNLPLLTIGNCSMYNISFNTGVSPTVLRPGCSLPNNTSSGVLNTTVCNNAIKYVGSSTIPIYTPSCFEPGSSLSHFEDMLYPTCSSSYGNDNYFVLSNVNLLGTTKRYLKPEERKVLCDIGYTVKSTFGSASTSNGYYNYGGTACAGITVAGLNDGINSNGSYTFIGSITTTGATSTSVSISGILSNDINATSFECLQDITSPTTTTIVNAFGTSTTISTFTSSTPGLHILRYVPINGTKRGNITYLYVYITFPFNSGECAPTPNACNLVLNGDFEQYSSLPTAINQVIKLCGWNWPFNNTQYEPSFFNSLTTFTLNNYAGIPCNIFGFQDCKNNIGNGYAEVKRSDHFGSKILLTKLMSPLLANTNYQLSFDVSLQDTKSNFASNLQAYLSSTTTNISFNTASNFEMSTVPNPSMLFTSPFVIRNTNGWDTVTFNFTTSTGGEQFLYLGFLKNSVLVSNTPTTLPICPNNLNDTTSSTLSSFERQLAYYIDNVSLIPTNGALFNLPASICSTQNLNDLSIYLSGTTPSGIFTGPGVTFANGIYSFNASVAGVGNTTIGYTFTNSSGCSTTLYDTISINTTSTNTIIIDAINDDFSNMPINGLSGGITTSVYANDMYNGVSSSATSLPNVTFSLVAPLSITGATINSSGLISIPAGTTSGTYTLTYSLSSIGNCNTTDTATVTIIVTNIILTPPLVAGIRANNVVNHIELQSNSKAIISGNFTTYNYISRPYVARINTDLTLDQTFSFSGNQGAMDLAIQSDDKIIAATWNTGFGGTSKGITRLLPNGGVDSSFNVGGIGIAKNYSYTNENAFSCAIQSDGKILLGGDFYYYNGIQRLGIVRLNSDGSIDPFFNPTLLNTYYRSVVTGITIQPDGKIILLGFFSPPTAGATQKNIIRLLTNGDIDTTFNAGDTVGSLVYNVDLSVSLYSPIVKAVVQPDGYIIIAGAFTKYNGTNVKSLVRLTSTGAIDNSFNTTNGVERAINELVLEPSTNKPIIGGEFTLFGTTSVKKLIRLTTSGVLDSTFSIGTGTTDTPISGCPYCYNYIKALQQQSDGKIIVGGKFTTFNGLSATNITRIFGSAGVQVKSNIIEYQSEPEIDTNPNYNSIIIYPNPSKGIFTIDLSYEKTPTTIAIYNVLGEFLYTELLTPQTQNQIDLTHLANGYYIARISNESANTQQKLIKN